MAPFRDLPIRSKLLIIILVASFIGLFAATFTVLVYESATFHKRAVENLQSVAKLYSLNMPAALRFSDPAAAEENLSTLESRLEIRAACVYTPNLTLFAKHFRAQNEGDSCEKPPTTSSHRFERDRLSLFMPISQGGEILGYLFIQSDLPSLYSRLARYGIMVGVVMLSLLVMAILLAGALKRYLTMPIVNLSRTARQITLEKDYRVRALILQNDEIGALTDAFNQMLEAIEESQSGLKESEAYKAGLIEQLKEAVRTRDEFISIASHELRTPLTPLKLQLQLLQRLVNSEAFARNEKAPLLKELIGPADRQIERLTKLVDNLLDVSRITTGLFKLNLEVMDLTLFLSEIIEQYRPEMEKIGCKLELNLAPSVIVNWDRLRIEQVIVNLITNAMKYGIGKPILIGLETERDQAIITVRDNGIGIAAGDRERIFERFERAVSSESYGGLGLGLYISKQIVIAHHGQIRVESVLGEGTTVIVKIPCGQEAP